MLRLVMSAVLCVAAVSAFNVSFVPDPIEVNKISGDPQILKCEVSKISQDEVHITSIVIQRTSALTSTNATIALITSFSPAHVADVNDTSVKVTGDVMGAGREFLQVSWPNPADTVEGKYFCEVFGVDSLGRPMSLIQPATVSAPVLGLSDVIDIVIQLEQSQKLMENQVGDLVSKYGTS